MAEQIISLDGGDEPCLLVRGDNASEIHRLAVEWVAGEEDPEWVRVADAVDDIRVQSIRAVGWCPYWACGCGTTQVHYINARPGSIGSFRGAFVALHHITTDEAERATP